MNKQDKDHEICNYCGNKIILNEVFSNEVIIIDHLFGYPSDKDTLRYSIKFCENCFDKIVSECKISPCIEKDLI